MAWLWWPSLPTARLALAIDHNEGFACDYSAGYVSVHWVGLAWVWMELGRRGGRERIRIEGRRGRGREDTEGERV